MVYGILNVRHAHDPDGSLYPAAGNGDPLVALELGDGQIRRLTASAVEVSDASSGRMQTVIGFRNIPIEVLVTESRLTIASVKWTKGGGWWGSGAIGIAIALTAQVVSKVRAAQRRKGTIMSGQVRYAWLNAAGYHNPAQGRRRQILRLCIADGTSGGQRPLVCDLTLPANVDAEAVARSVLQRAASWQLRYMPPPSQEQQAALHALANGAIEQRPGANGFALTSMPAMYQTTEEFAVGAQRAAWPPPTPGTAL